MLVALSCKSGMCLTCQNSGGEQTELMCLPGELPGFTFTRQVFHKI